MKEYIYINNKCWEIEIRAINIDDLAEKNAQTFPKSINDLKLGDFKIMSQEEAAKIYPEWFL